MRLPFQVVKTFTTQYSREEVLAFVQERLNRKSKLLFISFVEYIGSIKGATFSFYKNFNPSHGLSNPKIKGTILSESPTTIKVQISPHYLRVLFFLLFPCVFIPAAITSDEITIDGVLREPELFERILIGLFGGGGPLIFCYFDSIRPIKKAERWITDKLKLTER